MTNAELEAIARDIVDTVREEYPDVCEDEAVWDLCAATILAEGLSKSDATALRSLCCDYRGY